MIAICYLYLKLPISFLETVFLLMVCVVFIVAILKPFEDESHGVQTP
jgi:hypothetical protein